jgi:RHS repeat-associated protein
MKLRLLSFLLLVTFASLCRAQDDQPANYGPGWYAATNDAVGVEVPSFESDTSNPPYPGGSSAIAEAITPEITTLARNLQYNPTLIYNYVHDHIQYVHYFGSHKGAKMTLLEQSGNDFDQCALLVALLRAASLSPTYQFGVMEVPYIASNQQDYQHWVGATMPNTNWTSIEQLFVNINGNAGFPYAAYFSSGDTNDLLFHHVWVQLPLNGTNYELDPSVKVYQQVIGSNLDTAMQLNASTLISDVSSGSTATADYVQGLDEGNLRNDLNNWTANLVNYIQTNNPNASVQQIVGGQNIVPSSGQPLPLKTPFTNFTDSGSWPVSTWTYIPTGLMAVYTIVIPGTTPYSNSFFLPALEATRLSLVCTASGVAQLYQEDTQLASVQTTGTNTTFTPTTSIQHPYGTGNNWSFSLPGLSPRSTFADQSVSTAVYERTNASYVLLYAFDANAAWLTARQRQLDSYIQQGYGPSTTQVMTETLNVMGLNWLAQTELAKELVASQSETLLHYHHRLGRMAQETGRGYYIDVYEQVMGDMPTYTTNTTYAINQSFQLNGYFGSAFEHGIIQQLQNSNIVGASTVKLIELASTNNEKIYLATSSNWTSGADVSGNISNYNNSTLDSSYISQGYSLLIPQNGSIQIAGAGSWAGSGYVALQVTATGSQTMAMIIGGGYSGGYSSTTQPPNTSAITAIDLAQWGYINPQPATVSFPTSPAGDPVSMVDGSFQITSTDLSLGQDEPRGLNLTRYYSSARRNVNPAGMAPGWVHNYYCTALPTSDALMGMGSGATPQQMASMLVALRAAINVYNSAHLSASNCVITALIAKWGLDQLIGNAVSVTLGNNTLEFIKQPSGAYTPPGNCTMSLLQNNGSYWLEERHGRTFKFATNSFLTNIVDQYNQSLNLTYTASNWVYNVTDWKGRSLTFGYTGSNLTSVSDGTRSVSYGYTGGNLTSFTDAQGEPSSYAYDASNQIKATFDALSRLVITNFYDSYGHITTQFTQGDTNQTWQVYASGYNTVEVDPAGDQRQYTFDNQSRQIALQDALGNITQTIYDGQNHVIQTISPLNETNQFIYDGNNNLIETIDPLGYSNVFTFDANNNLIASTDARINTSHFGYNAEFSLTGQTNGNGDWTVFSFNSDGTLNTKTDSAGKTTFGYDSWGTLDNILYPGTFGSESFVNTALGDPVKHIDVNNNESSFLYNNRRQLTNSAGPTNLTTSTSFDPNANVSTTTDARGFVTSNNWSVTRHLLATIFPTTPQGVPIITNTYDVRDWLAETQNPLNKPTFYTNDAAHRLIASTDPLNRTMSFAYDNDSHQTNVTDAMTNKTAQFWNARGNLVKVIDAATNIVGRAYDGAGNLIFLTNRNNKVWQFQYDGDNHLTATISPLGHGVTNGYNDRGLLAATTNGLGQTTLFSYDARARMSAKTDNLGTINCQYDGDNNMTLLTNVDAGAKLSWGYDAYNRPTSFTSAAGYVIQYRYDNNGNVTNLIYPGNRTVNYSYDSNNRLTNVTDWAGRQTAYVYDLVGRMTSLTRPNNTLRAMGHDDDGELTSIVERTTDQYPIAFYTLNYNPAGRVQWEFKGPLPHNTNAPTTRTMTFDNDNRLATFNGTGVTIDGNGNMTYGPGTNSTFGTYTYDARNELTSAGGLSYGYDPAGNRTSMTNGSTNTTFVISPQGSQTLMRIKGTTTNYYIYGAGLLYEIDETPTTTNVAFYHFDCRGSTVAMTDTNGNPTDLVEYNPYGTTTYRYGTNDTPFLYNGQFGVQTDPNGLLYMRARYYNPYISRFLNPDPSGFAGGLNFYQFCDGNPISETDPFGLGAWTSIFGGLRMIGGGLEAATGYTLGVASGTAAVVTSETVVGAVGFGALAVGGAAVGAHGVDSFQTGFQQMITGQPATSLTSGALQSAGMSQNAANLTDAGISIVGSFGAGVAGSAVTASQLAASSTVAEVANAPLLTQMAYYETGQLSLSQNAFSYYSVNWPNAVDRGAAMVADQGWLGAWSMGSTTLGASEGTLFSTGLPTALGSGVGGSFFSGLGYGGQSYLGSGSTGSSTGK